MSYSRLLKRLGTVLDAELIAAHDQAHANWCGEVQGSSAARIICAHELVVKEMQARSIEHTPFLGLDDVELVVKAVWSAAFINRLPDSSFLYIAPGGKKDKDGRTTPRSLRFFPVKDASGKVDLPHLRNALARIPQAKISQAAKDAARKKAQRMLAESKKADDESLVDADVRLLPVDKADEDRQIVFGIVLEPDEVDSQGDTIRKEEIERAAHLWLARFQDRGLQHEKIVNSKAEIFESFLQRGDTKIGRQKVKDGTWLLMLHVIDKDLWAQIKEGDFTGFSIGGFARRVAA